MRCGIGVDVVPGTRLEPASGVPFGVCRGSPALQKRLRFDPKGFSYLLGIHRRMTYAKADTEVVMRSRFGSIDTVHGQTSLASIASIRDSTQQKYRQTKRSEKNSAESSGLGSIEQLPDIRHRPEELHRLIGKR